jgi:chaperonin GroES
MLLQPTIRKARNLLTVCPPIFCVHPWKSDGIAEGKAMQLKPLSDRIIVRRADSQEKTAGGVYLPDNAKNKPQKGKVLAAGPGRLLKDGKRRGLQVKEGDTVLFTSWAGDEFKDRGGDTILVMREEDILAVVDE